MENIELILKSVKTIEMTLKLVKTIELKSKSVNIIDQISNFQKKNIDDTDDKR